jgi:hypothetical protein
MTDEKLARRAPVHVVVRHPSKLAAAFRLCKLRPDHTAAPATRPAASTAARRQGSSPPARASAATYHRKVGERIRPRVSPPHVHALGNRLASDLGSQALSSSHVSYEQRCLTPAFSGAVNGIAGNHENCASRPPLQRLVRCGCGVVPIQKGRTSHSRSVQR